MGDSVFLFLNDDFPDIYNNLDKVEKRISEDEKIDALVWARRSIEAIIDEIYEKEGIYYYKNQSLAHKIDRLYHDNFLPLSLKKKYDDIKYYGNKASHNNKNYNVTVRDIRRVHRQLYDVSLNFYNNYSGAKDRLKSCYYYNFTPNDLREKKVTKKNIVEEETVSTINGSYLCYELNKLENSSKYVIEDSTELSDFKNYLHVERTIQKELQDKLEKAVSKEGCSLVLLAGSVGDGKSHLLAYFNKNHKDLLDNFKVHNDATESFSPDETSIDTLAKVLSPFNDNNIDRSIDKLVLSINLGVLNNFLDSIYSDNFSKLKSILNEMNIFDENDQQSKSENNPVSIVSFSDYNLFEFTDDRENRIKSDYISSLFDKVVSKNDNNPFYKAYLLDKKNNINNPCIHNYEMLFDDKVKNNIIQIIIKIIIKYKKIVSTRELFNLIHDMIVPYNMEEYDDSFSPIEYSDYLLPNLLFNSPNRSDLLKFINFEDPINKRNEITDQLLIDLYITDDVFGVLYEYMYVYNLDFLKYDFSNKSIKNVGIEENKLINTILRFSNIFGKPDILGVFTKSSYKEYLEYLYSFNFDTKGESSIGIEDLSVKIKKSIFDWKGYINENSICIDTFKDFKVAKEFKTRIVDFKHVSASHDTNRFKTSIQLNFGFNKNDKSIPLNIDYELYEMITKLVKGYKPNKYERRNLLLFDDFIESLIDLAHNEAYEIYFNDENIKFKLSFNEFESFEFKREGVN